MLRRVLERGSEIGRIKASLEQESYIFQKNKRQIPCKKILRRYGVKGNIDFRAHFALAPFGDIQKTAGVKERQIRLTPCKTCRG
jgi:hypothetical protein